MDPCVITVPLQVAALLGHLAEVARSSTGVWAEPGALCVWAAAGVSVRNAGAAGAEAAAVAVCLRHAGGGRAGSVRSGPVERRAGRHHGPAAIIVLW